MHIKGLARLSLATLTALWLGCSDGADGGTPDGGLVADMANARPAVAYETIFETEHANSIVALSQTRKRLLSLDEAKHYHLWDVHSKASLLHGTTLSTVTLGSNLLVAQTADFEVRDATDGHLLFAIPAASAKSAAPALDGSYVWSASSTALQVFSSIGAKLFSLSGDYSHASVFAASGEVRIANGAKGNNVVELLSVPGGTSKTTAPFQGAFYSWFVDGDHFLTDGAGVLHVYTSTGTANGAFPDGNLGIGLVKVGGIGDLVWFAASSDSIKFYPVTGSSSPTATFPLSGLAQVVPTLNGLGILEYGIPSLSIISFPAGKPQQTLFSSPLPYTGGFSLDSGGAWSVGNERGNLFYNDPLDMTATGQLGWGQPFSISGTTTRGGNEVAVVGFPWKTLPFDLSKTPARPLAALDQSGQHVEVSSDGATLVAMSLTYALASENRSVKVFSLPAGTVSHEWKFLPGVNPRLIDFTMAPGGSRIAIYTGTGVADRLNRQVTDLSGTMNIFTDTAYTPLLLSPNGAEYASVANPGTLSATTQIYHNGSLVTGIKGSAAGWIDDGRLLVNTYAGRVGPVFFSGALVYDAAGNLLSKTPLKSEIASFDYLPPDRLYSRADDTIYDLTTGNAVWTGLGIAGRVAGDSIIYISGREIRRVKY